MANQVFYARQAMGRIFLFFTLMRKTAKKNCLLEAVMSVSSRIGDSQMLQISVGSITKVIRQF